MLDFLKGKKTYIVVIIGVIVNGLVAMGYIGAEHLGVINSILGLLGLGAIRLGIANK